MPVYYVNKALHGVELRYPPSEKLAYVLVTRVRRLIPYFQAHPLVVLTAQGSVTETRSIGKNDQVGCGVG